MFVADGWAKNNGWQRETSGEQEIAGAAHGMMGFL